MQTQATKKYTRSSPRKMRLVIDLIRGKAAEEALAILKFSTKHAAKDAEMLLRSAIANLKNNRDEIYVDEGDMFVKEVFVNQGPTLKRISPAPQGRAYRIRKRSHHLTIVLATKD